MRTARSSIHWGGLHQAPPPRADPPGADTPEQTHPLGADTPQEQTTPRADTPPKSRHIPPGADTPLGADTPPEQTSPPPGSGFLTHAYENITLPQTSFAGGNKKLAVDLICDANVFTKSTSVN